MPFSESRHRNDFHCNSMDSTICGPLNKKEENVTKQTGSFFNIRNNVPERRIKIGRVNSLVDLKSVYFNIHRTLSCLKV